MKQEQRVQYLETGALGPLTTKELQILRNVIVENPDELTDVQKRVVDLFVNYLSGVIEENTTVGKIV